MNGLLERFGALEVANRILVVVTLAIACLLVVAVAFAALAFVFRWRNIAKKRRWDRLEASWEEALLDVLDAGPGTPFGPRIAPGEALYFVDFLSRYARRLRGSERDRVSEVAAPYLPLVVPQLRSRFPGVRARAVRTLGLLGLKLYAHQVISALDDPSPLVAMTAARELCRREQSSLAHAVLLKLGRFEDWSPLFLATMLASIGPGATQYLRATLGDASASRVSRTVAADALRLLNDPESADVAAQVVERGGSRDLVAAACRLLAACGAARHAPAVRVRARSDDAVIRAAAVAALGSIGNAGDVPLLVNAAAHPDVWVSWHAMHSLVALGARDAVERIARDDAAHRDAAREILAAA